MGTRDPEQPQLWIAASDLPVSPGHLFYTRLNALLDADGFDAFVENTCRYLLRVGVGPSWLGAASLLPAVDDTGTTPVTNVRLRRSTELWTDLDFHQALASNGCQTVDIHFETAHGNRCSCAGSQMRFSPLMTR